MLHISDEQRRARLARRHAIHPADRVADPVSATRAVGVLHATEAATVYLSLAARLQQPEIRAIDDALYGARTLVKQLAMRRTLFVFPRDLLPAAWGSAAARTAGAETRRLAKDLEAAGVPSGTAWIDQAVAGVVDRLSDGSELTAAQLRAELPELDQRVQYGSGKWSQVSPVGPRLLTTAGARGLIVRGTNQAHWRLNKPAWTATHAWLGESPAPTNEAAGYRELIRRWLGAFGPGTETDIVWWLGGTKSVVRSALADLDAVDVSLDNGTVGYVLPDDTHEEPAPEDWAALLPALDPTTMGWKERDFYLDPADVPYLFDTAGNAGTTAWWNGRIVGCWVQDDSGTVRVVARKPLPAEATAALEHEAARLTEWLDTVVVNTIYASPQMRRERLP